MTKQDVPLFRALQGVNVHNTEMMIAPKDGKKRVLLASGQPLFDAKGKKLGAVVSMHNITERKQAEEELRESERRLSMALEGADEGLWDYYPKTNEAYFSPRYFTMLGYEVDEFPHIFESWTRLLHPEDRPRAERRVKDFLENHEEQYAVEFRMKGKDGGWRWILSRGKAVEWDDDGSVTRMVGTHKDITERKEAEEELKIRREHLEELIDERTKDLQKANEGLMEEIAERRLVEEALRESERKYRDLVESANSIILRWDVEGNITYLNPYGLDLFGYKWEEVVGRNVVGTIVPETESFTERDLTLLMQDIQRDPNKYKNNENENLRKDGKRIWVSWTNRAVLDKEGKPVEILSIGNDITARKNLETQLQRVEKMEAIGTLAGGIAHDLNNILSGIVSYPDLLLMQLPEESPLREPIQVIQKSGDKAAAIVQDMMSLSRRGAAMKEVVNLNGILQEYQKSPEFERLELLHPDVEIETELETQLLNIKGAHVQLSTIIMNLVVNAVEAMPDGGRLFVSTENKYMDSPISGYEDVEEGDYVVLMVSDTGIGISPEDMNRIFEPFYSSKKMGRSGTGLGMAVVWGIVKDHRGYIDVKSTVGEGSTFYLYFPATREKQSEEYMSVSVDDYRGRGESILIIDDVEEQRQIASSILSELGYSVVTVSSGEEAVEYMEENAVDLLLLDMIMEPGIDGLDTYRKILEKCPRQRAVIASGYSETERVKEARRLGAGPYVKKPYVLETIGLAVRNELDREWRWFGIE
jgi:PAS domain S-box-containing protein